MKLFLIFPLLIFAGCTSIDKNLPPQSTVESVELPRFMGRWYVIASIPTMFEKDAYRAIETYTWNEKENRIDVDFHYHKSSFAGPLKSYPQKAFVYNQTSKAEWRIQFLWPFKFAYLIVGLAPDYSDAIIGVPDRKNVWIMARTPEMSEARYNELVEKIKTLGYDVTQLLRVPQDGRAD